MKKKYTDREACLRLALGMMDANTTLIEKDQYIWSFALSYYSAHYKDAKGMTEFAEQVSYDWDRAIKRIA